MTLSGYILLIDDQPVSAALTEYCANNNLAVRIINNQMDIKLSEMPEAILVSWHFIKTHPERISQLYEQYPVPLIIMHDIYEEAICIKALEAGADALMINPVQARELQARIIAIKRRIQMQDNPKIQYQFARWNLCPASRRLFNEHNQEVILSAGEYQLLSIFIHNPGQTLSRETLMHKTRQVDIDPLDRRMDVQISRLRQKIEPDAKNPVFIKTIRNGGYMFIPEVFIDEQE